jgi:hypothetical protein
MGWSVRFTKAWGWGVDKLADAVGSAVTTGADIACALGGIGLATAQGMNKTFCASYYGAGTAVGGLDVTGHLQGTSFDLNYTLPIQVNGYKDGEYLYNITDYLDPNVVLLASAAFIGTGVVLKTIGDVLKKWQQYRYDERYIQAHCGVKVGRPTRDEFLVGVAESVCASLAITTLTHTLISSVDSYSNLLGSDLYLTYPFEGEQRANSTYYNGPINSGSYPIAATLDPQVVHVQLPILGNTTILLDMAAKGVANYTYGGGLFFKENDSEKISPALSQIFSGIVGSSAYLAKNLFFRKGTVMRDERIQAARRGAYTSIQEEQLISSLANFEA